MNYVEVLRDVEILDMKIDSEGILLDWTYKGEKKPIIIVTTGEERISYLVERNNSVKYHLIKFAIQEIFNCVKELEDKGRSLKKLHAESA